MVTLKIYKSLAIILLMFASSTSAWAMSHDVAFDNGTYFERTTYLGQNIDFIFKAVTYSTREIRYKINDLDSNLNATINGITGEFSFISNEPGVFTFVITAYLLEAPGNDADCVLKVFVLGDNEMPCATLSGEVNSNIFSNNVSNVFVFAQLISNPEYLKTYFLTKSDENGFYSLELPEGTYQVGTMSIDEKEVFVDSTNISINCGDFLTKNLVLYESASIRFTSYPAYQLIISINYNFTYQAAVWTSKVEPVEFALVNSPDGMTISSTTGKLEWTPSTPGEYTFIIKAFYVNAPSVFVEQKLTASVVEYQIGQPCVHLFGVITYKNCEFIPSTIVTAYLPDFPYPYDDKPAYIYKTTVTDHLGQFGMLLPEGNYVLKFSGSKVIPEYYKDADTFENAQYINLTCGNNITIQPVINTEDQYDKFTISGRVTDEMSGEGLQSNITFSPINIEIPLFYDYGGYYNDITVETDENGYYTATVYAGLEYVGYASSFNSNYSVEYYNNVSNFDDAEPIFINQDITGIDFSLSLSNNEFYYIRGKVINNNNEPIDAFLQAYFVNTDTLENSFNLAFSTQTNDIGEFTFSGVVPGEYVIYSFPFDLNYLPGYYVENDFASEELLPATLITVNNENNEDQYIVKLKDLVRNDTGKTIPVVGNVYNSNNEPISGVTIRAKINDGNSVDWALSQTNGNYSLNNLVEGDFNIIAEKNGYEKFETTITINENDELVSKDIILLAKANSVYDTKQFKKLNVFPNPASKEIFVNLDINSDSDLKIINSFGNIVYESNYYSNTSDRIKIHIENLAQGIYYLIINNQNNCYQSTFVIVR